MIEGYETVYESKAIRARRAALKRKYNLTLEEWQSIFAAQAYKCAICRRPYTDFKNGLHTDHNHSMPREVRGLLCFPCNRLIPNRQNAAVLMQQVTNYLLNPPATDVLGETRYANAGKRGRRKSISKKTQKTQKTQKMRRRTVTTGG